MDDGHSRRRPLFRYPPDVHQSVNRFPNELPKVDSSVFIQSAKDAKPLLNDINKILDRIAGSKSYSDQLMEAAQFSNMEEVKRLINEVGMSTKPKVDFSPEGLKLNFLSKSAGKECCKIRLVLRWR